MARQATGIEIGARTVKAVRGAFKGETFQVTDFALGDVAGGGTIERWAGLPLSFKAPHARVALSGKDVNVRYTRVPRVPDWQLRKLMRFEVEEIGGTSGEGVASDFNLLPELPEAGGEDIVLLAMARESLLEDHLEGAKAIGVTIDCFSPSAVALYNAWLRFGVVQDDTVLLADIGHDNLDVAIVRGPDLLFARNLSGGGELFDQAIASQLQVAKEQASELKHEHADLRPGVRAQTPNAERVSRAIQGAGGQVLSLLQSALLFCKTQIRVSGLKIDRVELCGGGAGLPGLCEYLQRSLNVTVELFDPFEAVDLSGLDPN
ncbi:MAG TPA: pilus assembly protein PilM, partial [Planctomycetota bacterium]|nr:pilus assembly protein PilM [Planctomycetota bacterium]